MPDGSIAVNRSTDESQRYHVVTLFADHCLLCYSLSVDKLLAELGQVSAVIGAQWGDEGKGKVIDILAEHFDVVARACGGANAGHTIVVKDKKHVFRLLPSGSLHEHCSVFLGAGMVIHLPTLLEELQLLEDSGIKILHRLAIASQAHIVFDFHKEIDAALEEARAKSHGKGIGTTRKGIGPAYMDKMARIGVRVESLHTDLKSIQEQLSGRAAAIEKMYGVKVDVTREIAHLKQAKSKLEHCIVDNGTRHLVSLLKNGKKLLIEGAQATLLDIDHGTYPYVTSSSTTLAGALQGLGLAPKKMNSCIGVVKAYCTRVGEGPFLTEETGEICERLRKRGGEFGSVTGRPRRCGWLSIPELKHAIEVNGFDMLNLTKLDVLDEEDTIRVAVDYKSHGNGRAAVFEDLPGWKTSTQGVTDFKKLPGNAQSYIQFVEKQAGIPVRLIGSGQGREEMIVR